MFSKILFLGRDHAFISKKNGKYYVSDNDSKNGTFLIKAGSDSEIQLTPGEELEIENGDMVKFFIYGFEFCTQ